MTTEFQFIVADEPGSLFKVASCLSDTGINIDGISGISANGQGFIRLVTNNPSAAESAFNNAGFNFTTKEVIELNLANKPGELAKFTEKLANEGINLKEFYITMNQHQIIDTDNFEKAKQICTEFGFC